MRKIILSLTAMLFAISTAAAQTVAEIQERGRILVAMDLGSPPMQ